jgi:integration host factor subunit beta
VEVPSKRIPFFKPSKELRDLVNHASASGEPQAAVSTEPESNGSGHNPNHS